uniref:Retrotransposon gag domain-containing protein n=1 Tax=Vitis vinifera TaxID=29760 RepID=A5B209_VITVI|nr:hypothetical protein VITISV_037363 [Vitis vinifera]
MAFRRQLHQVEGQFRTLQNWNSNVSSNLCMPYWIRDQEGRLLIIRPHIVPLLPNFHGMESENPYAHIKEFEEVCNTFREGGASIDLMRLKLFPFTLKDKAKIWLNSLRPRSIRNWVDLQAEFLKKFFPTHRTNGLKRQISNFSAKENEKFYECWERYMEAINACPHHGFDTWLLVINFVDYPLVQGAPAGHESAETPIGHESNGAVAGEDNGERLVKRDTPQNKEFELSLNIMEATPEDQHSHQGRQDNLDEFRSMRDRMHPPRMSAPSCIVPPTEQLVIRPYLVPLLPTFHGMESENPYAHIKEFEDVCNTFQEGGASIDMMRLKLIPFTSNDKAKIWLNSLRPRSIRTWTDLQAEFLKKFFPTHRTNGLKRQISNFSAKENEKFYECWERYMEAINACPHHGFDTWLLVSYFYDGMSSSMKQLLETMCGGDFMSKNPEEAMDFLNYVAEVLRGWDEPTKGEVGKMKSQLSVFNAKAGIYTLKEDDDMKAKLAVVTRRLEELELKKVHEVQAVAEAPVQVNLCPNCQSYEHLVEECPAISTEREMFRDQANVVGQFKPNNNAPYGNTYNSSWRNHPNFSWKARATQYQQPDQPSQQSSSLEQAIANLSKVVGDFVGNQEAINAQINQRIDRVESTLNKRMDGMQNDMSQKFDNLQYSISRLTNLNTVQEKGRFPSQPHQNPKGVHEVESQEGESSQMKDVKALITLRSGKKIKKPTPKPHVEKEEEIKKGEEMEDKEKEIREKKKDSDSTMNAIPEKELQKEEMLKKSTSPPFPQALHGKKGIRNAAEILEVLRQVKVNIPLLDMIKQVPTYAKFLKDLCTIDSTHGEEWKFIQKYLKKNIQKCQSQLSGSFRRTPVHCSKWLRNSRSKRLISQPCKNLPSAWSDQLPMALTPSFQLRIAHRLKRWILDFLSFEMMKDLGKTQYTLRIKIFHDRKNRKTLFSQATYIDKLLINQFMGLDNPLKAIVHHLFIGEMTSLNYWDGFSMMSALVCMIAHWTEPMWDVESTLQLDSKGASIPMGPDDPHSELIYLVGMGYKGSIDSRFTVVHKGVLKKSKIVMHIPNLIRAWEMEKSKFFLTTGIRDIGSQESNASSRLQFGVETREIWPIKARLRKGHAIMG